MGLKKVFISLVFLMKPVFSQDELIENRRSNSPNHSLTNTHIIEEQNLNRGVDPYKELDQKKYKFFLTASLCCSYFALDFFINDLYATISAPPYTLNTYDAKTKKEGLKLLLTITSMIKYSLVTYVLSTYLTDSIDALE
jgi:hypothetical protein